MFAFEMRDGVEADFVVTASSIVFLMTSPKSFSR